ncbi:MAG TPA: LysM peptidoglycan-binding domain-containing protein [Candidatus Acidoferrales bacterium]|nr:LysM peptidoglycan-binding domain-containing protein [Candidatus Acidoferrales bacterium]
MRSPLQSVMFPVAIALILSFAGCDEGARIGQATRAPHPADALPAAIEIPLPIVAREAPPDMLLLNAKSGAARLAEAVEAEFAKGQQDAAAGRVDAARREYDRGAAWLTGSGYDLHADPRLEELYGRIVAAREALELSAGGTDKGSGDSVSAGAPEAPIDEIADLALPADPRMKETAEREMAALKHDLPLTVTDPVVSYMNFFETPRGRAIAARGLRRAGRYREMIARVLREEGLPQDLIYVAQAESAFEPMALSRARALGIWQFVAGTGARYGLDHTWWVDERRDPEKSTRAAARYLRDLYGMFGDWYLALAAYNTGEANVMKAVERTGYADFWELHRRSALPRQTRNYVPIILALAMIAKDPARHGIDVQQDEPLECEGVKPGHPIDLRLAADAINENVELLKALNPQLLRLVTPSDPDFVLLLPKGTAEQFRSEIGAIPPEKWLAWRRYQAAEGETLAALARRFSVTPAAIAEVNGMEPGTALQTGQRLTIPANRPAATGLGLLVRYRVRRGDTMERVARQFDVTPADIARWNAPHGAILVAGTTLKIYPGGHQLVGASAAKTSKGGQTKQLASIPRESAGAAGGSSTHPVGPGETLWSVARAYRITVEALRRANPFLSTRPLRVGDILKIPLPGAG